MKIFVSAIEFCRRNKLHTDIMRLVAATRGCDKSLRVYCSLIFSGQFYKTLTSVIYKCSYCFQNLKQWLHL